MVNPQVFFEKIFKVLQTRDNDTYFYNGGHYDTLCSIYKYLEHTVYDSIWQFANVPNDLPKIRDIKEIQPYTMSVTAKRNNNEYTNMEIVQRALVQKANILFEFSKKDDKFNMSVFDPLGCV